MQNILRCLFGSIICLGLSNCKTISSYKQKKEKDELIKWIITDSKEYPYVSKKFVHIDNLANLRLAINQNAILESINMSVLSGSLSHKDSSYLKKEISNQRDTIQIELLNGKNYRENGPAVNEYPYREIRYMNISDPIYLPKEKIYIICVENICGGRCGEGTIKAYRKKDKGFELVKFFTAWIS